MITINEKKDCCGCNACGDICPKDAITFYKDNEGFLYPQVLYSSCIDCGLCEKVCPMGTITVALDRFDIPRVFAAYSKDELIRLDSTSGGIHSVLALSQYDNNAYVGGAVYNKDYTVSQIIDNDPDRLAEIRSSKYLQSSSIGVYKKIKSLLDKGNNVFYCGTPCQIHALYKYLPHDYDNLVSCDFVCRGVNSPKVFLSYMKMQESKYGARAKHIKFKAKKWGWHNFSMKIVFENGMEYCQDRWHDLFFIGYLQYGNFVRPSCYSCPFKRKSAADITLADFWGIEDLSQDMDQDMGTSLVMIHTKKGQSLFEIIKHNINYKEFSFNDAIQGNPAIIEPVRSVNFEVRRIFFDDIEKLHFETVAMKHFLKGISPQMNLKERIYRKYSELISFKNHCRKIDFSISNAIEYIKLNYFTSAIIRRRCSFLENQKYSIIEFGKDSQIVAKANLNIGVKQVKNSRLETRLLLERNARLYINGDFDIYAGSYIRIMENGTLILHGGFINENVQITCGGVVEIGKGCAIARDVIIRSNDGHEIMKEGYCSSKAIHIGEHVWIGQGAMILKGVTIGDGAIIGAGSVVTKNIPKYAVAVGNPARVIRRNIKWR